jgi:hypothetical protein
MKLSRMLLFLSALFIILSPPRVYAEDVCAVVKIEILQELTFERQAFDARMKITNGTSASLESIRVDVWITDDEGDNKTAQFFISDPESDGLIGDPDGTGVIPGETAAEIHWLIIPSQGAGGESSEGIPYFCGATLSYTINGQPEVMEVNPDTIIVKPMPLLTLDYFMPQFVHGDDPILVSGLRTMVSVLPGTLRSIQDNQESWRTNRDF